MAAILTMYRIWFERPLPPEFAHLLEDTAVALGPGSATPEAPFSALPGAHAVIASSRLHYDGVVMDLAPTLRVIARTGIGCDNIAIPDATARRIAVCNAPDAPTISTAEHAILLILAAAKKLKRNMGAKLSAVEPGLELDGQRLGLVGLGRIGSRVARFAAALGMQVVAFDPWLPAERANELGVELAPTLETVLRTSDIVSLHVPLMPETRRMINAERLAQMKRGAYLVNTARGGLVDEAALLDALERGHLAGAGLDVFDPEPPDPGSPLLHRDDVITTPHMASSTTAGRRRMWEGAITQALQVLRGERPLHLVNPEVWPLDR